MIVIRARRARLWFVFGLAVLLVASGAWMTATSDRVLKVIGIVWIAFFGLALVAIPIKAFGRRLTLVLDRGGLITLPSRTPLRRVPWDQVTKVKVVSVFGQKMVGVNVRDWSVLGDNALSRAVRTADFKVSGCAINLPDSMIDRPARELAELIERYCASPEERSRLGVWDPSSPDPR